MHRPKNRGRQHHPEGGGGESSTTQKKGGESSSHPRRRGDGSNHQGRTAEPHLKEEVEKAPPPERRGRDSQTNPKKGGTQPSLGGVAFLCYFSALLFFFFVFLGACSFPLLFFDGCCFVFSPRSFGLSFPSSWGYTGSLLLLLCLCPK